ncbi:MAG: hypothetical protein QNJ92_06825 [Alphaproteobacteria bacterium]|nr:hypothetical protein [Alphaproteobacteria bacterium]
MTEKPMWTPGPWSRGVEGNFRIYAPDGLGRQSGPVAAALHRHDNDERTANAHLIAAAPEQNAVCEKARTLAYDIVFNLPAFDVERLQERASELMTEANAVLAKARGETS